MLYQPIWSPDGKRIAFSDAENKLYVLTLDDKKVAIIAENPRGRVHDYSWSADSGFLAYLLDNPSNFSSLYIWSAADGQNHRVTDDYFDIGGPSWDPEGNYLYFISIHTFYPQLSQIEFNYATNRGGSLYALALRKDTKNPFPPESDEVTITKEGESADKGKAMPTRIRSRDKKDAEQKTKRKKRRNSNPSASISTDSRTASPASPWTPTICPAWSPPRAISFTPAMARPFYGRDILPHQRSNRLFHERSQGNHARRKTRQLRHLAGRQQIDRPRRFRLQTLDAKPEGKPSAKPVSTANLMSDRIPHEEWEEIYNEVGRRYRDFFYVKNMNGYDWNALLEQYRPLVGLRRPPLRSQLRSRRTRLRTQRLPRLYRRRRLGNAQAPARSLCPARALSSTPPPAAITFPKSSAARTRKRIYRSPLTEVGVDVKVGDYVLAIDGQDLAAKDNPYECLRNKANRPVQWTVNSKPTLDGSRNVTYRPITSETNLIYLEWVDHNREAVTKATGGKIGYIHIPDMGDDGIREFIKNYYPQIRKQGLIVDVRGNGGGNISQMLIERLRRELLGVGYDRQTTRRKPIRTAVFYGPKVCLINETSASDGDIFPYMFRQAGLGPLIGKRTWGGVVGIAGRGPLLDGGDRVCSRICHRLRRRPIRHRRPRRGSRHRRRK